MGSDDLELLLMVCLGQLLHLTKDVHLLCLSLMDTLLELLVVNLGLLQELLELRYLPLKDCDVELGCFGCPHQLSLAKA